MHASFSCYNHPLTSECSSYKISSLLSNLQQCPCWQEKSKPLQWQPHASSELTALCCLRSFYQGHHASQGPCTQCAVPCLVPVLKLYPLLATLPLKLHHGQPVHDAAGVLWVSFRNQGSPGARTASATAPKPTLCNPLQPVKPYLADDKQVLPPHSTFPDLALDASSHLALIVVEVSTVKVAIAPIYGYFHRLRHLPWSRLQNEQGRGNRPAFCSRSPFQPKSSLSL